MTPDRLARNAARARGRAAWGRRCLALGLTSGLLLTIACAHNRPQSQEAVRGRSVARLSIDVAPSLEMERGSYESDVVGAIAEVGDFFSACGFRLPANQVLDSVQVFATPLAAREYLSTKYGVPLEATPETFAGTVVENRLFLVSRESYREIWQHLYPEWPWGERTYRSLIVHEIAHRMHEVIVRDIYGSSDAMGPTWFFEGLAVVCARQFEAQEPSLSRQEIRELVGSGRSPAISYPLYGRIVRALAAEFGVRRLMSEAARPDFPEVLWSAGR